MKEPLSRASECRLNKCFISIPSPASNLAVSLSQPRKDSTTSGWKKSPWARRVCGAMEEDFLDCDLAAVDRLERKEEKKKGRKKGRKKEEKRNSIKKTAQGQ